MLYGIKKRNVLLSWRQDAATGQWLASHGLPNWFAFSFRKDF